MRTARQALDATRGTNEAALAGGDALRGRRATGAAGAATGSTTHQATLEQNYRSTQPVLDLTNALMSQMSRSFRKDLFTDDALS